MHSELRSEYNELILILKLNVDVCLSIYHLYVRRQQQACTRRRKIFVFGICINQESVVQEVITRENITQGIHHTRSVLKPGKYYTGHDITIFDSNLKIGKTSYKNLQVGKVIHGHFKTGKSLHGKILWNRKAITQGSLQRTVPFCYRFQKRERIFIQQDSILQMTSTSMRDNFSCNILLMFYSSHSWNIFFWISFSYVR